VKMLCAVISAVAVLGNVEIREDSATGNFAVVSDQDNSDLCVQTGDSEQFCVHATLEAAQSAAANRAALRAADQTGMQQALDDADTNWSERLDEALSVMTTMSEDLLAEVNLDDKKSAFQTSAELGADSVVQFLSDRLIKLEGKAAPEIGSFKTDQQAALDDVEDDINAMIQAIDAKIPGDVSSLESEVNSKLAAAKGQASEIKAIATNLEAQFLAQQNAANSKLSNFEAGAVASITEASASIMSGKRKVWSGGCHYSNQGSWSWYCLTRSDYSHFKQDDGSDGFSIVSSHRFRTRIKGLHRVKFWAWSHSSRSYNQVYFHNNHRWDGRTRRGMAGRWCHRPKWHDNWGDITWPLNSGQDIRMRMARSCGSWSYHAWSSSGTHSRVQIEWIGSN